MTLEEKAELYEKFVHFVIYDPGCWRTFTNKERLNLASLPGLLAEAQNRVYDMALGDDGEAWCEAHKYLERERPDLYQGLITYQPLRKKHEAK